VRALDLFCGGGGASAGLVWAGYEVTGVDIKPQEHYPFAFGKADVLMLPVDWLATFDLIWASPPCQRYTNSARQARSTHRHPDLVPPVRRMLERAGVPFVIENVLAAPLRRDLLLCGSMFGLQLVRHRIFEVHGFHVPQPRHEPHHPEFVSPHGSPGLPVAEEIERWRSKPRRQSLPRERHGSEEEWRRGLGIDWLDWKGLKEAIPPAYSRYIGEALRVVAPAPAKDSPLPVVP
jgi:DNA (cytosine-5)-methyltransferase 1